MTRGRRTIRLAKWAGVGLGVLVALAWAVSMRWAVGFDAARFLVGVDSGGLFAVWRDRPTIDIGWGYATTEPRWPPSPEIVLQKRLISHVYSHAITPLWLPLAVLAVPTAWLFWLDRRKPRPGFCACGYDLTGNVSGVCPECGQPFEAKGDGP